MRTKLDKCVEFYRSQVRMIYGPTVSAGLVDTIRVPWQGQDTPIIQMAYSSPRDKVIVVRPYDQQAVGVTLKAIQSAGLSAYTSKTEIFVSIPSPSEETLERNRKRVRELAEEGKVAARQVRQEFRDALKGLPEDERKRTEKLVQKELDATITEIDADCKARVAKL